MNLGVCYYPEHWPEERWAEDAQQMKALGLRYVRIGEFAWSRLEPRPGLLDWAWLDRVLEVLGAAGLEVVLGTPTATPPKWLVEAHPCTHATDIHGQVRKFGSRRHYSFSSPAYRRESARIVKLIAQRYGQHPAVAGWQTDNEYGCHDTTRSYGDTDLAAFRGWLKERYGSPEALNRAWGNVFWSMEYSEFSQVELPNQTVTEANPAHWMDFYRFSSDQVAQYNQMQVEILRAHSPGRFITHNFMGFFPDFDHFKVGQSLDLASWDSYPLGFTDQSWLPDAVKLRYARSGHPDIAAFNHDLYRGVGRGRWWVMEQQPGPVNWAPYNPSPAPGVVRQWTWEALAHGAETVSYFRWRQAPFAQEQMHAGLNRPDFTPDLAYFEAQEVAREIQALQPHAELLTPRQARVAMVLDYQADWALRIQPQGASFSYQQLFFQFYSGLRQLGLDIDILAPGQPLDGYALVVVPSLPMISEAALEAFDRFEGPILFGPRTGSKTHDFQIPAQLAPGPLAQLIPLKVVRVESMRPGLEERVQWSGRWLPVERWKEWVESDLTPIAQFGDGRGAVFAHKQRYYLAGWPGTELTSSLLQHLVSRASLRAVPLPEGLRLRRRGQVTFAFNHTASLLQAPAPSQARFLLGDALVRPYGVVAWTD